MSKASNRTWPRSVWAVFAGILVNVIPATLLDAIFHATGVYPPMGERMADALFGLAISYRLVLAVTGGYVTARLAPAHPLKHVLVGGGIGTLAATAGYLAMGDMGPAWYSIGLIVMALPVSLAGAKLYRPASLVAVG